MSPSARTPVDQNFKPMRYIAIVLLTGLLSSALDTVAQEKCGTHFRAYAEKQAYLNARQSIENIIFHTRSSTPTLIQHIPVRVHIVTLNDGTGGYPAGSVQTHIDRLNTEFSGANLSFYICEYTTINSSYYYSLDDEAERNALRDSSYPSFDVVDLFIVDHIEDALGFAYLPPGRSMLVMRGSEMAESTLEHEMGHVFGLLHTHESDFGDELVNGSNCSTAGDRFCSTPADMNLQSHVGLGQCCAFGCVSFACDYVGICQDSNGDYYSPSVENYMSYAPTSCTSEFTWEQEEYMYQVALNDSTRQFSCSSCLAASVAGIPATSGASYVAGEFWIHDQFNSNLNMNLYTPSPYGTSTWYATRSIRLNPGFRFTPSTGVSLKAIVDPCP